MESGIRVVESSQVETVAKALSSPLRLRILRSLIQKKMNIQELAKELDILQSTCTVNVQVLEKAGLIQTRLIPAARGNQKICEVINTEVVLPLKDDYVDEDTHLMQINMPVGLYTDFKIHPPCGMLSETEIIDYLDSEQAFLNPQRSHAQLIWFTDGYLEYHFPANIQNGRKIKSILIQAEVCSEFPGYLKDWPSDITLWINGHEIGTWTSPGDMGGTRGRFTPKWWGVENTQFGMLKAWRVTHEGSFIDGVPSSKVHLEDLKLSESPRIDVRIGIKEDSPNRGGLNIFGEKFGNHPQGITLQMETEDPR